MDEQGAALIGALFAGAITAFGGISVILWKVWQVLKKMFPRTASAADDLDELLGERQPVSDADHAGARARRKTGSFQRVVRDELAHQLDPLERRFGRIEDSLDANTKGITELVAGQQGQARLIAELARSHGDVVARTDEHSAALNIAKADESLVAEQVPG